MAFTPTPKTSGDLIRSADWNDHVAETQRLETDKVNRAGADTLQGPLTINGNLGLGVSPGAKLDVGGNIRLRGGALLDAGGTARLSMPDNADLHLYDAGGTSRLTIADNGRLDLKQHNGVVRIRIATNGLVGINRTDPSYQLDVNGSARITSLDVTNDMRVRGGALLDAGGTARLSMPDNGNLHLYDAGGTSRLTIADNGRLDLKRHDGVVRIRIAANGLVGINRANPSYQLDVNGSARVSSLRVNDEIISPGAKNVSMLTGFLADGSTIPTPEGFTEAQCKWLVSPYVLSPPRFDINENGRNAQFMVECYATNTRQVHCKWYQRGHSSSPEWEGYSGWVSYITIGVK